MSDELIPALGNKTPLMVADTPCIDSLAGKSEIGLVHTIPKGMKPGSDTANLSVLGYDPAIYYSGRSPLEALSIGVDMMDTDIAIRCNLVTLTEEGPYEDKTIIDHSSGEISTEDAAILMEAVRAKLEDELYKYYVGTSYRHLTIWRNGKVASLKEPHDILGQAIKDYLPEDTALKEMMIKSYDILNEHPINIKRKEKGLNKANSIWFWGAGTKPALSSFEEKNNKKGAMISAVDLLKGIAVGAGMKVITVPGANGTLHTNYEGKAEAALEVILKHNYDFVYIHVEAPDEMGHQGGLENKVKAIHYLDQRVIKPVIDGMEASGEEFRLLVLPDHPTPIRLRTHTDDPVPYLLYDSRINKENTYLYNEIDAMSSGIVVTKGYTIIDRLFDKGE